MQITKETSEWDRDCDRNVIIVANSSQDVMIISVERVLPQGEAEGNETVGQTDGVAQVKDMARLFPVQPDILISAVLCYEINFLVSYLYFEGDKGLGG